MSLLNFILLFTIVLCIVHTFLSKNLIKSVGGGGGGGVACYTGTKFFSELVSGINHRSMTAYITHHARRMGKH